MFGILMLILFILLIYGLIKIGIEAIYLLAFLGFLYVIKDILIGIFAGILPIVKFVGLLFLALLCLALIIEVIDRLKGKKETVIQEEVVEVIKTKESEEAFDTESFGRFE
jgi:hypothetical protein|nr:MAG TPA: hypothetical protein [Caudoviricetes sp.]